MYSKLKNEVLPLLIPSNSRILVAISGGPDSVALAHILWRYVLEVRERKISLVMSHVNHGVRRESDEEELLVKDLAEKWGIPLIIHRFNANEYAKEIGESFEAAARQWRYSRWKEDMKKEGCNLLATAHHLGDQAETVLYRLIRGSGTAGLAGIYPQRDGIIRPLLSITKEEIFSYCNKEQLPYAIDASNYEAIYVRNKIRLELIPELEKSYNPRIIEALGRTAELLRWDEEYLTDLAEAAWPKYFIQGTEEKLGIKLEVFDEPHALLSRILRKAIGIMTGDPRGIGFNYIEQIINSKGKTGWKQDLPGLTVYIDYKGIWFTRNKEEEILELKNSEDFLSTPVHFGKWSEWRDSHGNVWHMGLFAEEEAKVALQNLNLPNDITVSKQSFARIDIEKNIGILQWRNRCPGDKMWFKGIGRKSLKKVFQEAKVGKERNSIPLLALSNEILWIPGLKRSGRFLPQNKDKMIGLVIRVNRYK